MTTKITKKKTSASQLGRLLPLLGRRWVTPLVALEHCGCLRLAARIADFRRQGHAIESRWHQTKTGARVKAYRRAAE